MRDLTRAEYEELAEFRYQIRRFLHFSETAVREEGIEPQQHQALLAIKGAPADEAPSVGYLARRLILKHQSAVGLVDRLEQSGLVKRCSAPEDARQVLVRLTPRGERLLHRLSVTHRAELEDIAPSLAASLRAILPRNTKKHVA